MKQTLFLYNYMSNDEWLKKTKIPIQFIGFGFIENVKLYRIDREHYAVKNHAKPWGMNRLYGGIYILDKAEFYLRVLDALSGSSMGILRRNHDFDLMHREEVDVTPIKFDTIPELYNMFFRESEQTIKCVTYLMNQKNDIMEYKLKNTTRNREFIGFDPTNFIKLLRKEKGE